MCPGSVLVCWLLLCAACMCASLVELASRPACIEESGTVVPEGSPATCDEGREGGEGWRDMVNTMRHTRGRECALVVLQRVCEEWREGIQKIATRRIGSRAALNERVRREREELAGGRRRGAQATRRRGSARG